MNVKLYIALFISIFTLLSSGTAQSSILKKLRPGTQKGESTKHQLAFNGLPRTFVFYKPSSFEAGKTYPLMVVFHGMGGSGESIQETTGFNAIADQYGFFVVYPDSAGPEWKLTGRPENNDIGYSKQLVETLLRKHPIDPARIYISGFSAGGGIAQAFTCLNAGKVAGIANVSQNLGEKLAAACAQSATPVSYVLFHGTADAISPYNGDTNSLSALKTAEFWAAQNACPQEPTLENIPGKLSNGANVTNTGRFWFGCANGTTVSFYTVEGSGHSWPGGTRNTRTQGLTSESLKASLIIWQQLSPHSSQPSR